MLVYQRLAIELLPSGKHTKKLWKDPACYQWENSVQYVDWAIFNSYEKLPEGISLDKNKRTTYHVGNPIRNLQFWRIYNASYHLFLVILWMVSDIWAYHMSAKFSQNSQALDCMAFQSGTDALPSWDPRWCTIGCCWTNLVCGLVLVNDDFIRWVSLYHNFQLVINYLSRKLCSALGSFKSFLRQIVHL